MSTLATSSLVFTCRQGRRRRRARPRSCSSSTTCPGPCTGPSAPSPRAGPTFARSSRGRSAGTLGSTRSTSTCSATRGGWRGRRSRRDSSPKYPPGPSLAIFLPPRLTEASPSRIRKNSCPGLPSSVSTLPLGTVTSSDARPMVARSLLVQAEKSQVLARWSSLMSLRGMAPEGNAAPQALHSRSPCAPLGLGFNTPFTCRCGLRNKAFVPSGRLTRPQRGGAVARVPENHRSHERY